MRKVTMGVSEMVERALLQYEHEVDNAPLRPDSKEVYKRNAAAFVRWLRGDFEPGSKAKRGKYGRRGGR